MATQEDLILINRLSKGDGKAFTAFYKNCRTPFFEHFIILYREEERIGFSRMRSKETGMYLDDLYQMSTMRLYEMVCMGLMKVSGVDILYTNKYSETKPLTCSLFTFLKKIGENVFREMLRANAHSGEIDLDDMLHSLENKDDECCPDAFFDEDDGEYLMVVIAKVVMSRMTEVCRKIFTKLYYTEDKNKVKGSEIYAELGYSSPSAFRNQKARCVEKFKQAFDYYLTER